MILNTLFKQLNFIFLLVILLSSCDVNTKISEKDAWLSYNLELNALGDADNLILLKLNDIDSTFQLHWFMFQESDSKKAFSRMTFKDKYRKNNDIYSLSPTIVFNELKISPSEIYPFPLDQHPEFSINRKTKVLSTLTQELNLTSKISKNKVQELITLHKEWKEQKVDLN